MSASEDSRLHWEQDVAKLLERQRKERCLTESMMIPDREALKFLSAEDATRHVVLPLRLDGTDIVMAMSNPSDLALADQLGFKMGKRVRAVLAVETSIKNCIRKYYGHGSSVRDETVAINPGPEVDAPVVIIHHEKDARLEPPAPEPAPEPAPDTKRVEPTADVISKALAFLLIEKGIIGRDELVERMKAIREKEKG